MQIDNTQARAIKLVESTLQLSNLDLVASFVLSGDKSSKMSVTLSLRSEIIDPAASEAEVSACFCYMFMLGEISIKFYQFNAPHFLPA